MICSKSRLIIRVFLLIAGIPATTYYLFWARRQSEGTTIRYYRARILHREGSSVSPHQRNFSWYSKIALVMVNDILFY
ncbi:hypothetical protein GGU10DRAFT_370013 [Lentinula aff. detonsa]|uniref:Uncharacterized protein n=1 Tax=Lentinula aff. detonsa TaxID=2804958 RepID=A0AA38KKC9_9AGAR|nr:hypothetical protein GGU10DRAFT_370013 [Lentinula aff. detonsa]